MDIARGRDGFAFLVNDIPLRIKINRLGLIEKRTTTCFPEEIRVLGGREGSREAESR